MRKTIIALMVFLVLMSQAALPGSKSPPVTKDPIDAWMDAAMEQAVSTPEMVAVYTEAVKKWDERLNRVYQACRAKLKRPQDRAALKEAQRKWLAYRDAEQELITAVCYFTPDGSPAGTIAQVESHGQLVRLVRQRVLRLEEYLKILEGEGSL
jgi:uncharacterized protein YecT (DUF1311 family)